MNTTQSKIHLVPKIRLTLERITNPPAAAEILERAETFAGILCSTDVRFKASDGRDYYYSLKDNKRCSRYDSLAWQVFTELNHYVEPTDDDLYNLTDADYLAYLDMYTSKWVEDVA